VWFNFVEVNTLFVGGGIEPDVVEVFESSGWVNQENVSLE
jgi:hypothetical protein